MGREQKNLSHTVHGIPLPEGLRESQKLPIPLFTPFTKAEQGSHDENISPAQGDAVLIFPYYYPSPTPRLKPRLGHPGTRLSSVQISTTEFPTLHWSCTVPLRSTQPRADSSLPTPNLSLG
jgi:hypothetical protein